MQLLHPDDREWVLALVDHCNRTAEPFRAEYRLVHRDGRVVWVQDESLVVCDEDGRPLFTQGYLLDVTERKEAEQRLVAEQGVARVLAEATGLAEATPALIGGRLRRARLAVGDALAARPRGRRPPLERRDLPARRGSRRPGRGRRREPIWEDAGEPGTFAAPVLLRSELLGVLEFTGAARAGREPAADGQRDREPARAVRRAQAGGDEAVASGAARRADRPAEPEALPRSRRPGARAGAARRVAHMPSC